MSEPTDDTIMYLWVAIGSPDNTPDKIRVESCRDCAALVPLSQFDIHGRRHARTPRPRHAPEGPEGALGE